MNVHLPPPVKAGDAVSLIAPASAVDPEKLAEGIELLRSWGLEPIVNPLVYRPRAYVAGFDDERAQAFLDAFDDDTTRAVICIGGGFGCTRLAPFLSAEKLRQHNVLAKRFLGFSDITAIHCALRLAVPGYVSFHTPMLATSTFINCTYESRDAFQKALFAHSLKEAAPPLKGRCLQMGRASSSTGLVRGRLIGGNLALLSSVVGTPWQEEFEGCVLLLEDVNEPMYRLDRMFTQLIVSRGGVAALGQLAALVLGDFGDLFLRDVTKAHVAANQQCEDVKAWFWLEQMGLPRDLPVLIDVPIGHIKDNRVAALGAQVDVDLNSGELKVAEDY